MASNTDARVLLTLNEPVAKLCVPPVQRSPPENACMVPLDPGGWLLNPVKERENVAFPVLEVNSPPAGNPGLPEVRRRWRRANRR